MQKKGGLEYSNFRKSEGDLFTSLKADQNRIDSRLRSSVSRENKDSKNNNEENQNNTKIEDDSEDLKKMLGAHEDILKAALGGGSYQNLIPKPNLGDKEIFRGAHLKSHSMTSPAYLS